MKPWKDTDESQMHMTKWTNSVWKVSVLLYGSNYMTLFAKGKIIEMEKDQWFPEIWGDGGRVD